MAKATRDHPRLASDITRSWVAVAIWVPFLVLVPVLLYRLLGPDELTSDGVIRLTFFIAWTIFSAIIIALTVAVYARADSAELRRWLIATRPPESVGQRLWWALNGGGAIYWALTGATVTLYALVSLVISPDGAHPLVVWSGVAVTVASAALIIVAFATHYARLDAVHDGFAFPGERHPVFTDYLYLAVQVSTTFGGSDVEVVTTHTRRAVSMHSIIAFTFNTVLVALLVSVLISNVQ